MSLKQASLISIDSLEAQDLDLIFKRAELFKSTLQKNGTLQSVVDVSKNKDKVILMLFTEASTRTKLSFEIASSRLGLSCFTLPIKESSIAKGESLEDTFLTLQNLYPNLIVFRSQNLLSLETSLMQAKCPLINGGLGTKEHPTQALTDAFTVLQVKKKIAGLKILTIGDVRHSRVANSNLKLFKKLGAELAYCSPLAFMPKNEEWSNIKRFESLSQGLEWADVAMCLRLQKERHTVGSMGYSIAEYRDKYCLTMSHIENLKKEIMVLHPGPVIKEIDISEEVFKSKSCYILKQIENAVFVRASLLSYILDLEVKS